MLEGPRRARATSIKHEQNSRPMPVAPKHIRRWVWFAVGALLAASLALIASVSRRVPAGSSKIEHADVAFDISPAGDQVVFSSAKGDLFLLNLNSQAVRQLTKTIAVETTPTFSPDGKAIVFASVVGGQQRKQICRILIDGTQRQELTNDVNVSDAFPKCSPDGSRLAFARAHKVRPSSMGGTAWDDWDIYITNVDGSNATRVTRNNYHGINRIEFAPDGQSIVFSADNNRLASDLVMNVFEVAVSGIDPPKAGVPQPMSAGKYAAWASDPDYSPDGTSLVVISDRMSPYKYDLILIEMASANAVALGVTGISPYNKQPVFSPDGKQIFFLAGTRRNEGSRPIFSLWSIGVDGKNAREIASSQLFTDPLEWRTQE